nr:hypothetical protein [Candidatus Njordarchaeota archaeon]
MGKKVKHMGMAMTEEEHEKWHKERGEITLREHEALIKKMGITKEQHEEWHKKHGMSPEGKSESARKLINPYAIGGGFLNYCVTQGWLIQEGKGRSVRYYSTKRGEEELKKFGIKV